MPKFLNPITITTPSGSAPLVVNSTTVVSNLNADLLDGQHGTYYIDTSSGAQTKSGSLYLGSTLQAGFSRLKVLDYNNNGTPTNGIRIATNIPQTSGVGMYSLIFEGYRYGESNPEMWVVSFYIYNNGSGVVFYNYGGSCHGGKYPSLVQLGWVGGLANIFILSDLVYFRRFTVRAVAGNMSETNAHFEGWTHSDSNPTLAGATGVVTVSFNNEFGNAAVKGALSVAGALTGTTASFSGQITSTVATGTAPFVVTSTTQVNNLNAQFLGGQLSTYYAAASTLSSYLPLSGGQMTGYIGLQSAGGTNGFYNGTGDSATYSLYNFKLSGWYGMAFENASTGGTYPSQVVGVIDFRSGTIDMKGGFKVSGASVITENQSITISGDASGSGKTAINLTLASVGTAGTYRSVTTDAKGRVTAGTNPTTLAGYGITDALDTSATAQTKAGNLTLNGTFTQVGEMLAIDAAGCIHNSNVEAFYQLSRRLQAFSHLGSTTVLEIEVLALGGYAGEPKRTTWRLSSRSALYVTRTDEHGGVSNISLKILNDTAVADANGQNAKYVVGLICGSGANYLMYYMRARFVEDTVSSRWVTITQKATTSATQSGSAMTYTTIWVANTGFTDTSFTEVITDAKARQLTLTATTGTAPLVVSSTTLVSNLNVQYLNGQDNAFYQNASNLNAGTLPAARLPAFSGDATSTAGASALTLANSGVTAGTYTKITVDAKGRATAGASLASADLPTYTGTLTSSQVTTALGFTPYNATNPSGYITSSASITGYSGGVSVSDNRSIATTPQTINMGVVFDFKTNAADGLSDGGTYFGEMTFRKYGSNTDWSGGPSHQLGFTENGNVWQRSGSSTTWGAWKKLLDTTNFSSHALPLSGGTLTGGLTGTSASFVGLVTIDNSTPADILRLRSGGSTVWKLGVTDTSGSYLNITADYGNVTIYKLNGNITTPGSFVSTVATGTAPLSVASTTLVSNLNVQYLNGQLGSYYAAASSLSSYLPLAGGTMTGALLSSAKFETTGNITGATFYGAGTGLTGTAASLTAGAVAWTGVTGKPTTLSGYGITDAIDTSATAQTKSGSLTVNSALTSGGNFYAATTVQYSNRQQIYTIYHGGAQDLNWKKIADITIPVGLYRGVTFKVDVVDNQGNFGWNSDCFAMTFFATCIRSGGVQDDFNNAVVTGPVADYVRVVKTALGVYELQIRQLADWQTYVYTAEATINSGTTVTYVSGTPPNGSTAGTAYTAGATWTHKFARIAAAGQITSTVVTGTAPLVIASTTLVSNLNSQYLGGQLGSYYQNASNLNAGTVPAAQMPAHTGDVTSTAGSVALTLANSGVTAGTYTKVTVDAKGRVTTGASLASADLPTYTGTITSSQVTTGLGYTPAYGTAAYQSKSLDTVSTPGLYQYDGTFAGTKPPDSKPNYRTIEIGSDGRWSQIALPWDNDGLYFRRKQDTTYTAWRTVLHDGNYSSYALPLAGGTLTGALAGTSASFSSTVTATGQINANGGLSVVGGIYQSVYTRRQISLSGPGTSNFGNWKQFIRLWAATGSGANMFTLKVSVRGQWNWSAVFGTVEAYYSLYLPADSTISTIRDFRIVHVSGPAIDNIRLGDAVIENGFVSIPVWCANTNGLEATIEQWTGSQILGTITTAVSEALPAFIAPSFRGGLTSDGPLTVTDSSSGVLLASANDARFYIRSNTAGAWLDIRSETNGYAAVNLYGGGATTGRWSAGMTGGSSSYRITSGAQGAGTVFMEMNSSTNATNFPNALQQGGNQVVHAGNYTSYAMKYGGSPGVDLNTLTTAGVYRIQNTEANRPNDYGQLLVMYGGSDTITQIYGHYADGTLKTRSGNPTNVGGSGSWTAWRTLLGDHNYSSYALPLTGGTLSGALISTAKFETTGNITGATFYGAGTGLTGTASGLSIGGSSASSTTATQVSRSTGVIADVFAPGTGTYNRHQVYANATEFGVEAAIATDAVGGTKLPIYLTWRGGYATQGGLKVTGVSSAELGGNAIIHAGNYTSYPDATKLPLAGGTLTGGLTGTSANFSSDVTWSGYNSGNARAVRIGYSGGNYGSIGYGINYTGTTGSHTYAFNDAVTRIDLADGIQVYSAAGAAAGTGVSWTTLLEATRGNGNLRWKGNTVLDTNNYSSFALPLAGGTMTGNIILPATGYVGLSGGSTYGIGTLSSNRNSGVFDTLESTGTDPLELNYYQGGSVKIGSGTYGSKSLYAAGIFDGGNQVLHAGNYNSYAMLTTGIPSGSDQYVNFRVLRNSAASPADGMYVGYGNAGSGRTRIYGEGSTTSHVYPDASGNLMRSDGAAYLHSSNYLSTYMAPEVAYTTVVDASGYVWIRIPYSGFNQGMSPIEFYATRSINDNSNTPYGGPTAKFVIQSMEWHSGQQMATVQYGERGDSSSLGAAYYITHAKVTNLSGGGYWVYLRLRTGTTAGVTYRFRKSAVGGQNINFSSIESTTDPSGAATLYYGFNLISAGNEARFYRDGNLVLDAASYSSYALPLTGGTMSGHLLSGAGYQIKWSDGTASAPGYSFYAETGTGMFRVGANTLGFATGGVQRLSIDGSGNATLTGAITASSFSGSGASLTGTASSLTAGAVAWSGVTSKPTTISGYGITDAIDTSTAQTKTGVLTLGVSARTTSYTAPSLQLYTGDNTPPGLAFHRGGYSATLLYESDGELYVNPWTTRAQTGKLLAVGNYSSYALPLSGGTLTGALTSNSKIETTGNVIAGNFSGPGTSLTGTASGLSIGGSSASCTGNAATATSSPLLSALGNYVWSASTLPTGYNQGIQASFVQGSNGFQSYGSVITVNTYFGGGGALQMYVPYSPTYGGTGMQVRFGNYDVSSGNSWTGWKTLLASDNYGTYSTFTGTVTGTNFSGPGTGLTGTAASLTAGAVAWSGVTGKPTTLSGYGITDALDTSSTAQTKAGNLTLSANLTVSGTTTTKSTGTTTGTPLLRFAQTIGDAYSTSFTITHNLGTQDVQVQVRRLSDNAIGNYTSSIVATNANAVTVTFAAAPSASQYRVVVFG